jgi:hypothetical protein
MARNDMPYCRGFRAFPWLTPGRDPFDIHIEMAVEAERLGFDAGRHDHRHGVPLHGARRLRDAVGAGRSHRPYLRGAAGSRAAIP